MSNLLSKTSTNTPHELEDAGTRMYDLAKILWPINRSLTGPGVRETLSVLQKEIPDLEIESVPSGSQAFDWTVPEEWLIREAYIIDPNGRKFADFKDNNLHIMGYSVAVNEEMELADLLPHLYSLPEQPEAIPYLTSYYKKRWGFCLKHTELEKLPKGRYKVVIDSEHIAGQLNYGELVIKGSSKNEIFFSTYICHPAMANNEISGPVVQTELAKWISSLPKRYYTYRFFFGPETIGSIAYLSRRINHLKENVRAGFVISCVGDERAYSFLPSREGDSLADQVALHVLQKKVESFITYSFLDRGSDERQYCSPGVDLPVCSIMRSKYGTYPEYHTSLDDLSLISPNGLLGSLNIYKECVQVLEMNRIYMAKYPCEPQLGKRGLYPSLSTKDIAAEVFDLVNLLAYCDGKRDLLGICDVVKQEISSAHERLKPIVDAGLVDVMG